jgi:ABC-2 type transport system permease protein
MTAPAPTISDASRTQGPSYVGALATLYVLTLRQYFHGKRWVVVALLFLLPAGLAVLLRTTARDVPPMGLEFALAMMFIPQLLLPLVALLYASGMIQDEQEEQTITYLLIRPLPKWAIYIVKLLATLTTTVVLTGFFTLLTYGVIYVGAEQPPEGVFVRGLKAAGIHSLAMIAYCSIFGLMSLITKRTLVIGIVYVALVEGVLANLPFGIRLLTVIYYARLIVYRTLPFIVKGPHGGTENVTAIAWQLDVDNDPNLLEHPQLSTCYTVLLATSLACAIVAAWLCSRREFHVKTPEKA